MRQRGGERGAARVRGRSETSPLRPPVRGVSPNDEVDSGKSSEGLRRHLRIPDWRHLASACVKAKGAVFELTPAEAWSVVVLVARKDRMDRFRPRAIHPLNRALDRGGAEAPLKAHPAECIPIDVRSARGARGAEDRHG
jgi:hypothetical protein